MENVHLKEKIHFSCIFLNIFLIIIIIIIINDLNAVSRATEVITPYSASHFADEGNSVTLSCSYTGSVRGLHWYRQYAGSPPKFLILDSI